MKKKHLNEKQTLITQMIEMYDIKDIKDIQEALKDLLGSTIQSMLESEMDEHLGYSSFELILVPKRTKDISEIENKIIRMYARGMGTRQISEQMSLWRIPYGNKMWYVV